MEAFEKLMSLFMTPKCYEDIFLNLNFNNVDCLKMFISKGLGYGILAGSILLRVPQILKIVFAKSGEGLSVTSEILMLISIFGSMAYGYFKKFHIAAYGDSYSLYVQGIIILLLVLFYQKQTVAMLLSLLSAGAATFLLFNNMIPDDVILGLNGLSLILSVIAKLNQAFLNYRKSSTGNLSAITLILQFLGVVARIFTSIQETGDFYLILTSAVLSFVNGLLVLQLLYYWNSPAASAKKAKKFVKKTN